MRATPGLALIGSACLFLACGRQTEPGNGGGGSGSSGGPRSNATPFDMPPPPEGLRSVSSTEFQIYVPLGWTAEPRSDSPYYKMAGEWDSPDERVAGSFEIGVFPSNGKSISELADDRVRLLREEPVAHSENAAIQLADGTEGQLVLMEIDNPATGTRTVYAYVFAPSDSQSYWMVFFQLAGAIDDQRIAAGSDWHRQITECTRSFVPAPAAR